jgi:hypothetical protein
MLTMYDSYQRTSVLIRSSTVDDSNGSRNGAGAGAGASGSGPRLQRTPLLQDRNNTNPQPRRGTTSTTTSTEPDSNTKRKTESTTAAAAAAATMTTSQAAGAAAAVAPAVITTKISESNTSAASAAAAKQKQNQKLSHATTTKTKTKTTTTTTTTTPAESSDNTTTTTTGNDSKNAGSTTSTRTSEIEYHSCRIRFIDPTMSTCHRAAFGGNFGDLLGPDIVKRLVELHFNNNKNNNNDNNNDAGDGGNIGRDGKNCSAQNIPVMDYETIIKPKVAAGLLNATNVTEIEREKLLTEQQEIYQNSYGPCLVTVGSLMRDIRPNYDHVWGTGSYGMTKDFITNTSGVCKKPLGQNFTRTHKSTSTTIYSVRGPLTATLLKQQCSRRRQRKITIQIYDFETQTTTKDLMKPSTIIPSAGDAGFLIPFIFPEFGVTTISVNVNNNNYYNKNNNKNNNNNASSSSTKKSPCVILHKYDADVLLGVNQTTAVTSDGISSSSSNNNNNTSFETKQQLPSSSSTVVFKFLPVVQSWQSMVQNITTHCQSVASSSLHGLILADAYGLPTRWIQESSSVIPFKFYDYFASIEYKRTATTLQDVVRDGGNIATYSKPLSLQQRRSYAHRIMKTFPYHLFETVHV